MDWKELPFDVPANLEIVWIRIDRWSGAPFLAQWKAVKNDFTSVTNSIEYPAFMVSTWSSQ